MKVIGLAILVSAVGLCAGAPYLDRIVLSSSMYVTPGDKHGIQINSFNYPNPFSPEAKQTWTISTDPKARITVNCKDIQMKTLGDDCGDFGFTMTDGDEVTRVCESKPFKVVSKTSELTFFLRLGPHAEEVKSTVYCQLNSQYV